MRNGIEEIKSRPLEYVADFAAILCVFACVFGLLIIAPEVDAAISAERVNNLPEGRGE